jgi:hypothetical protein
MVSHGTVASSAEKHETSTKNLKAPREQIYPKKKDQPVAPKKKKQTQIHPPVPIKISPLPFKAENYIPTSTTPDTTQNSTKKIIEQHIFNSSAFTSSMHSTTFIKPRKQNFHPYKKKSAVKTPDHTLLSSYMHLLEAAKRVRPVSTPIHVLPYYISEMECVLTQERNELDGLLNEFTNKDIFMEHGLYNCWEGL